MSRLRRSTAVIVAIGGLGLIGSAFQGLVRVDGTLQAATRDVREQQRHTLDVKFHVAPGCPVVETQPL